MDYHLPDHVSFGLLGRSAVVLDLSADRYFLLDDIDTAVVTALGAPKRPGSPCARLEALIRRGFVRPGPGTPVAPVEAAPLRRSALESRRDDGALPLWQVAHLRIHAGAALRWRGLAAAIGQARKRRLRLCKDGDRLSPGEAGMIARGYDKTRVFVPAQRLCVPDSLALAQALWCRGIAADVFFGVRLNPFAAHAWVQQENLLLSDPLNIVADYTPVFRL